MNSSTASSCKDDGGCNGELVCFSVPAEMNPSDEKADYCYPDWTAGSMQGWETYQP
ncbi:MAG: hypothetical protein ABIJ09_14580 [Pseudomonadota bacterium]